MPAAPGVAGRRDVLAQGVAGLVDEHDDALGGVDAVAEEAAVRGAPADQQHGGDRRRRRREDDDRQGKVHDPSPGAAGRARITCIG
jgi:hypothetical protein